MVLKTARRRWRNGSNVVPIRFQVVISESIIRNGSRLMSTIIQKARFNIFQKTSHITQYII